MFGEPKHIVCPSCGVKIYKKPFSIVDSPNANPCGEIPLDESEETILRYEEGDKDGI